MVLKFWMLKNLQDWWLVSQSSLPETGDPLGRKKDPLWWESSVFCDGIPGHLKRCCHWYTSGIKCRQTTVCFLFSVTRGLELYPDPLLPDPPTQPTVKNWSLQKLPKWTAYFLGAFSSKTVVNLANFPLSQCDGCISLLIWKNVCPNNLQFTQSWYIRYTW